jgi:hypothetical protein
MIDTVSIAAAASDPAGATPSVSPSVPHQSEARMFAQLMTQPNQATASAAPAGIGDVARSVAAQFGTQPRSFEDMRRSMLSMDYRDPIKSNIELTYHTMEMHAYLAKMSMSIHLATAGSNVFGSLLKNQQ